jgi:hypothetical protein
LSCFSPAKLLNTCCGFASSRFLAAPSILPEDLRWMLVAALHLMTSSARASSVGGISRSSSFAAFSQRELGGLLIQHQTRPAWCRRTNCGVVRVQQNGVRSPWRDLNRSESRTVATGAARERFRTIQVYFRDLPVPLWQDSGAANRAGTWRR